MADERPKVGRGEGGNLVWYINSQGHEHYVAQDRHNAEVARREAYNRQEAERRLQAAIRYDAERSAPAPTPTPERGKDRGR